MQSFSQYPHTFVKRTLTSILGNTSVVIIRLMKHPQLWISPVSFFFFSEVSAKKLKFVKAIRIYFGTLYLTKYPSYVKIAFHFISLIVSDGKDN